MKLSLKNVINYSLITLLYGLFLWWATQSWGWSRSDVLTLLTINVVSMLPQAFIELRRYQLTPKSKDFEGELILLDASADLQVSRDWRGRQRSGWLILTPTRLVFRFLNQRLKFERRDMLLDDIKQFNERWASNFVKGIWIQGHHEEDDLYAIKNPEEWVKQLNQVRDS